MYDVLYELSILSEALQNRNVTIVYADKLIRRTIRYLESLKDVKKGNKLIEASEAVQVMKLGTLNLTDNKKISIINRNQFLVSLINNMTRRLHTENDLISEFRVLDPTEWPADIEIGYGENEIQSLCTRFNLTSPMQCINAFRDYIDTGGKVVPEDVEILIRYINTVPCSSAECERGFSNMNIILNDHRNRILIENLANLLFVKMNGPPQQLFKPDDYVKAWLRSHRSADDNKTRKIQPQDPEHNPIWNIL